MTATLKRWLPPRLWLFFGIVVVLVVAAVLAPWIAPRDPNVQNLLGRLKAPGTEARGVTYLLGSDELGRDLLSRLIHGARVSLMVAALSVIVSGIFGTALGMIAGWYRGVVGMIIMRVVDIVLSVPAILLAIITVAIMGPGLVNVVAVLAFTRWPRYARVAYGQTLGLLNLPYVRLSRFMGASTARVLIRHILPNIIGPIMVVVTLEFGLMVLFEAGLSFLGLGVQPPTPSWGAILSAGRSYVTTAWWIAVFPGVFLFLLILSVNVLGDHVRDVVEGRR
ncbi:peptide/nickel transport system permease protein [Gemmobacter megaterium]|uniref:Peptide/nickel transport system permease protein n=1 Tax=Gemmobacter megaterium TaxID=1086013 RepID=A0A1N7NH43_9RHOB|nr:ABC transporter permease [Gemmobacter megaterium]GGE15110.1 ABC transporter permease [Gemmobacter megaterium]SIS97499.1 peptide/nickel transport system permease protein [Gemmobacter megaterium]